MAGRERRVQADAGVGHAEAGRADHPHAVAAADAQQFGAGRAGQSGRDHHQGPDAPPPAILGDTEHGWRRDGNDRQVDLVGDAVHQGALHLQPGIGEHPQHGRVLAQRLRGKRAEPPAAGQRDQT